MILSMPDCLGTHPQLSLALSAEATRAGGSPALREAIGNGNSLSGNAADCVDQFLPPSFRCPCRGCRHALPAPAIAFHLQGHGRAPDR